MGHDFPPQPPFYLVVLLNNILDEVEFLWLEQGCFYVRLDLSLLQDFSAQSRTNTVDIG